MRPFIFVVLISNCAVQRLFKPICYPDPALASLRLQPPLAVQVRSVYYRRANYQVRLFSCY
jgi:hypothetical protein